MTLILNVLYSNAKVDPESEEAIKPDPQETEKASSWIEAKTAQKGLEIGLLSLGLLIPLILVWALPD